MTVAELKAALEGVPDDAIVMVGGDSSRNYATLEEVDVTYQGMVYLD